MKPNFVIDDKTIRLVYRRFELDEGQEIVGHKHFIDHPMIFLDGVVDVLLDGKTVQVTAPDHLLIKAGVKHGFRAVTDCKWLCIFIPPKDFETLFPEFWGDAENV